MKISGAITTLLTMVPLALAVGPIVQLPLNTIVNCAVGATDFAYTNMTLTPWTPCVGGKNILTINGTLSTPIIQGAKMTIVGRYLNKIVYTDNQDFMVFLQANGYPSPFPVPVPASTPISLNLALPFKAGFWTGIPTYFQLLFTNGNGHTLMCFYTQLMPETC